MRDVIANDEVKKPQAEAIIAEIRERWDTWDLKEILCYNLIHSTLVSWLHILLVTVALIQRKQFRHST
jgi:hypothetical protein